PWVSLVSGLGVSEKIQRSMRLFQFKPRELSPFETHTGHQAALPKDERDDGFPGFRAVKGSSLAHGDDRNVGVQAYLESRIPAELSQRIVRIEQHNQGCLFGTRLKTERQGREIVVVPGL